jgi:cob(I)alamin adenosyltransferase
MGYRLSKIYTRTGDKGETGLGDGSRVSKDDLRVETYGTVDELNSALGIVLAYPELPQNIHIMLVKIQHQLFELGSELCIPGHVVSKAEDATQLEIWLDSLNETLPPLKDFILPGGNFMAAHCHMARAISRRAERLMVALHHRKVLNEHSLTYINRLSDLLFVMARTLARLNGGQEVLWQRELS